MSKESTAARRYSLGEIDAMRRHLYAIEYANERWPYLVGDFGYTPSGGFAQEQRDRELRIEDQLRTYMTGGVGAEELSKKAEEAKSAQAAWMAEEEAKKTEARLRCEYGPR